MGDDTIIGSSPVGKRLGSIQKREKNYCLIFGNKRLPIVTKITIGRASDNDVVIDNKLASRYHAFIQKIKTSISSRTSTVRTVPISMASAFPLTST